jgi:hypothetical protein
MLSGLWPGFAGLFGQFAVFVYEGLHAGLFRQFAWLGVRDWVGCAGSAPCWGVRDGRGNG